MRAFNWIFLTLTLALLFIFSGEARSEVYRWTDSKGVVHFGDRPVSTDPAEVKEVVVPTSNVSKAFKPRPSDRANAVGEGTGNSPLAEPYVAEETTKDSPQGRGGAAQSKANCQAKVAAYHDSVACFAACSSTNGAYNSGRNNANCGHCVEQTMPSC